MYTSGSPPSNIGESVSNFGEPIAHIRERTPRRPLRPRVRHRFNVRADNFIGGEPPAARPLRRFITIPDVVYHTLHCHNLFIRSLISRAPHMVFRFEIRFLQLRRRSDEARTVVAVHQHL
ncbi:hypothetical protein EVAR_51041_1 [Eumeta japonica]|uniref:Uncharacterized protein n=1 Tax=Eumeta variegata TaxID=151549 RepID=A0A4C1Y7F2_EUMVA|nr:hypothetical protein EVAR_51041_1 [Eumeta japonica]